MRENKTWKTVHSSPQGSPSSNDLRLISVNNARNWGRNGDESQLIVALMGSYKSCQTCRGMNQSSFHLLLSICLLHTHTHTHRDSVDFDWLSCSCCAYLSQLRRWRQQWRILCPTPPTMCHHPAPHSQMCIYMYVWLSVCVCSISPWTTFVDLQLYKLQSFAHLPHCCCRFLFNLTFIALYIRLSLCLYVCLSLSLPLPLSV